MTQPSEQEVFTGTKPVEDRHRFDEAALSAWMAATVPDFAGPLEVRQFKGGQSNPTYQVLTPRRAYVLRRKPPGKLLPSAHAVDREYRVIAALHPTGFPVARPWGLCTDEGVIGTMFYVMDQVEGRILWDNALPGLSPERRRAIYEAKIDTLAALHRIDPVAVGLGDYGKPGNYFARQIDRWTKQYQASETETIPAMNALIDWLPRTVPADDQTGIVHGDYRLDNMILHPSEDRVVAVLDWELSTLGNPLADFTYYLMNWVMPAEVRGGLLGRDLAELGIPSQKEAIARYCAATGRAGIPETDWYFAYNLFRLAAILQGIAGRVRDGTAASPQARAMATRVTPLAEGALSFARAAGLST
jgi:aminoglycoside phosphotransferase (APT) family kinase protein